jgi:hypothetical protein
VDRSNQEISFSVLLRRNSSQVIALSKHDVRIQVSVAGKHHVNDQFAVPFRGPTLHTRTLSCPVCVYIIDRFFFFSLVG